MPRPAPPLCRRVPGRRTPTTFPARDAVCRSARIDSARRTGGFDINLYRPSSRRTGALRLKLYRRRPADHALRGVPPAREHGPAGRRRAPVRDPPVGKARTRVDLRLRSPVPRRRRRHGGVRDRFDEAFLAISARRGRRRRLQPARARCAGMRGATSLCSAPTPVPPPGGYPAQPRLHRPRRSRTTQSWRGCSSSCSRPLRPEDARGEDRDLAKELVGRIERGLDGVASLDEDRVLRRLLGTVRRRLRTNFFQTDDGRQPRASGSRSSSTPAACRTCRCRGRCSSCSSIRREIEGVHLRGGPGRARRPALVGPPRGLPHRGARADEGTEGEERRDRAVGRQGRLRREATPTDADASWRCTRSRRATGLFVRGPARRHRQPRRRPTSSRHPSVVRHDGDDAYLVVAADKGTATFSDIANEIARERGFWLGDAFASGGSAGYDHKAMGITARGGVGLRPPPLPRSRHRSRRRRTSPSSASATCRATCSATACCSRRTSASSRRSTTGTSSSTRPGSGRLVRRAPAAVRAAALVVGRLRRVAHLDRAAASSPAPRSRSRSRPRCAPALGIGAGDAHARRADPGDPARPVDLL